MDGDPAAGKRKNRIDLVVHRAPGRRERVPRLPMRAAGALVSDDIARFDAQIRAALAQHRPHRADFRSAQVEYRIGERCVGRVAGSHRGAVAARERRVERVDQLLVLVPQSSTRSRASALDRSFAVTSTIGITRS